MMDANQKWDVDEAIENMKLLAEYKPWWIEEPTNPDDILGHAKIAEALRPYNIGVVSFCRVAGCLARQNMFEIVGHW